ncbi:MAG: UDP-N-acetylmuramoyl-L-alanine--D-glutamate ligase [Candidatus Omnitrophica bacterium]|nr:UDP-N-acetylmuramoyl-L-alanine--D-glutamate ligase [Candidatus Omnitrophota bacterium]
MDVLTGKKISVLGLGKSGYESALFLKEHGARVYVSELAVQDDFLRLQEDLESRGIPTELGGHDVPRILDSHFIVCSPGIPPHAEVLRAAHENQKLVISEIELAYRFFEGELIAVTGTNGKTTVTTLSAALARHFTGQAFSCGNIGNPFIGEIRRGNTRGYAVVEVSSFQLETIKMFRPKVAFLLNIEPDHIDWHGNYENYIRAKFRIFKNQKPEDAAIVNFKDDVIQQSIASIASRKFFFNQHEADNPNWDAVLALCDVYGWSRQEGERFLESAPPIEHRLECFINREETGGILYINDSKSTNPSSLAYALKRQKQKVILIAGGKNKGNHFDSLRALVKEKVKHLILFGQCKDLMAEDLQGTASCELGGDFSDVLARVYKAAREDDVVLFSPGCASFDMFQNYEHRGREFKEKVRAYYARLSLSLAGEWT